MKLFKVKRNKIGASKVYPGDVFTYGKSNYVNTYGVKFDSKIEFYFYHLLRQANISFAFQVPFELQPKVVKQEAVQMKTKVKLVDRTYLLPIEIIVDFIIHIGDKMIIVDTKGFLMEKTAIKIKILKYKLYRLDINFDIILCSSQKSAHEIVNKISAGLQPKDI